MKQYWCESSEHFLRKWSRTWILTYLGTETGPKIGFLRPIFHTPLNALQWRHNYRGSVSNHRRLGCLLNLLFRRRSKEISTLRVTGLCEGNSPVTGEFFAQRASDAENVSIWWRHHGTCNEHAKQCWCETSEHFLRKWPKSRVLTYLLCGFNHLSTPKSRCQLC